MQIQNTPSVYFQFEDSVQKTNFSGDVLFQLSCTNQKVNELEYKDKIRPNPMDLEQSIEVATLKEYSKIKTEDFFEQFDNNFVITFEQDRPVLRETHSDPIVKAQDENCIQHNSISINSPEQMEKTNNSCQPLVKKNSNCSVFQEDLIRSDIVGMIKEGRQSPIPSFEIKKRTVFKNRENLMSNANNFKITKKKIINHNTLEIFANNKPLQLSDQFALLNSREAKQCFTSRIIKKDNQRVTKLADTNLIVDKSCKSKILHQRHSNLSLRSTTLDNWKRRFQMQRKQVDKRSTQTGCIFTRPYSFR